MSANVSRAPYRWRALVPFGETSQNIDQLEKRELPQHQSRTSDAAVSHRGGVPHPFNGVTEKHNNNNNSACNKCTLVRKVIQHLLVDVTAQGDANDLIFEDYSGGGTAKQ